MKSRLLGTTKAMIFCAAIMALAGVASGCEKTAVRTSVSPCFRVLPQAHAAVGSQAKFVDVARRKGAVVYPGSGGPPITRPASAGGGATSFPDRSPRLPTLDPNDPRRDDCIVAYRGSFDAGHISLLRGPARTGRYAVVVVGVHSGRVRAVLLTDRLPPALHHH